MTTMNLIPLSNNAKETCENLSSSLLLTQYKRVMTNDKNKLIILKKHTRQSLINITHLL